MPTVPFCRHGECRAPSRRKCFAPSPRTSQSRPGKATEGGDRLTRFKATLTDLVCGRVLLTAAYQRTEDELPRRESQHQANNHAFAKGWAERLVRTQLSRCYNQAVLQELTGQGIQRCFVPHSTAEDPCRRWQGQGGAITGVPGRGPMVPCSRPRYRVCASGLRRLRNRLVAAAAQPLPSEAAASSGRGREHA